MEHGNAFGFANANAKLILSTWRVHQAKPKASGPFIRCNLSYYCGCHCCGMPHFSHHYDPRLGHPILAQFASLVAALAPAGKVLLPWRLKLNILESPGFSPRGLDWAVRAEFLRRISKSKKTKLCRPFLPEMAAG